MLQKFQVRALQPVRHDSCRGFIPCAQNIQNVPDIIEVTGSSSIPNGFIRLGCGGIVIFISSPFYPSVALHVFWGLHHMWNLRRFCLFARNCSATVIWLQPHALKTDVRNTHLPHHIRYHNISHIFSWYYTTFFFLLIFSIVAWRLYSGYCIYIWEFLSLPGSKLFSDVLWTWSWKSMVIWHIYSGSRIHCMNIWQQPSVTIVDSVFSISFKRSSGPKNQKRTPVLRSEDLLDLDLSEAVFVPSPQQAHRVFTSKTDSGWHYCFFWGELLGVFWMFSYVFYYFIWGLRDGNIVLIPLRSGFNSSNRYGRRTGSRCRASALVSWILLGFVWALGDLLIQDLLVINGHTSS